MKILIAAQGFFPAKKYGGPPVSIENFCNLMKDSLESYIVTSDHEFGSNKRLEGIKEGWQKVGYANVIYLSEKQKNSTVFEKIIDSIKPDWIYLNSLFDAANVLPFLEIANKKHIKVLLAPRGELCSGAFKKKYKKLPYIMYLRSRGWLRNIYYQSTSEEETHAIIKYLHSETEKIYFLTNIPSLPNCECEHHEKAAGQGKFIFLSRIHPKKNLIGAIKYFCNIQGNVAFDIYGPMEDKAYWNECQKEIDKLPANIKVNYCGLVSHDEIHQVFSQYDAFVFPTFSENYGHVIAESLFSKTPVIISDNTPWTDVNQNNAGFSFPLKNEESFTGAIQKIVDLEPQAYKKLSDAAYSYVLNKTKIEQLKNSYLKVLQVDYES